MLPAVVSSQAKTRVRFFPFRVESAKSELNLMRISDLLLLYSLFFSSCLFFPPTLAKDKARHRAHAEEGATA